jgi:hypothetical protein
VPIESQPVVCCVQVNVFGTKNQAKVALSLLVCAGFSLQAVNNYFADPEQIDWSNPGGWL